MERGRGMSQWHESNEEIDMENLRDEELKNRIMELNDNQLSNIKNLSYYYLIARTLKLIKSIENENILDGIDDEREKRIIFESFHTIINSFKKFHGYMEEEEIEEESNIILDTREELYNLKSALKAYEIEISYIKELVDHYSMKKMIVSEYENLDINRLSVSLLIDRIRTTLENTREYHSFTLIVSNILSILPFRMSKNRYFDVVRTTLLRNLGGLPLNVAKAQIEEYKKLFDSRLSGDYGITFDSFFVQIKRFKNMRLESKTEDELEDISKDIIKLIEEINRLSLFIKDLGIILNRLIIIYLDKTGFSKNDHIRDLYAKWKVYYEKRDENLLNDLMENCNGQIERLELELLERANDLEKLNKKLIGKLDSLDEDFNSKIIFTTKVLNYYNDLNFASKELLLADKFEMADKNYLFHLVDNLIQYMNRSISAMNNLERKLRMRRFLSSLQLPFENMEEFFSYIEYSLDGRVTAKEEIMFSLDMANFILDKYSTNTSDN